jgi:paraquat-inducible protein B
VTLALYPGLFHFEGAPAAERAAAFKAALASLVRQGLRASLDRDPPLIGGYQVGFEMISGAPAATLDVAARQPQIPTAPGGGLQSMVTRVNKIPLDQIGQNVLDLTKQIDQLASSPKLKESVAELDASLRDIHKTIKEISPKMNQLVQTLRATAEQLDRRVGSYSMTLLSFGR